MIYFNKGINVMKYILDKPIEQENDDLLNRSDFAKHFAKDIVMLSERNNFTVALNGSWGSGKTSLINLIKNEIVRLRDYDEEVFSYPIIIDFAPWNSLDENGIINQFFNAFKSNFETEKIKAFLQNSKTNFAINLLKDLPIIGKPFKLLKSFMDKYLKDFLNKEKDLITTKTKIVNHLQKIKFNYIVFIDDIDRLNNKEIRLLFQLIKAVCDFPNVTYVLAYDKEIVANALANEQTTDGYKYLEKIIQLSIDIPEPNEKDFQHYLFTKMDGILQLAPDNKFDETRWSYIFRNGFYNYFHTLRDVNRYINSALFKFPSYKDVLNSLDFLTMEAISLFEPKLLQFIKSNKEILCKSATSYDSKQIKNVEPIEKSCKEISNNFELIKYIFPYLNTNAWNFGGFMDISHWQQYKSNGRICYDKHFDFYFSGKLDNESISRTDVKNVISNNDKEFRDLYFKSLNNKTFSLFLQYLVGFVKDKLYIDEILDFIPELINYSKSFEDLSGLFVVRKNTLLEFILDEIFELKGNEYSFDWLRLLYEVSTNYEMLIDMLYHIAANTHIYHNGEIKKEPFFSEDQILALHNFLVRILKDYIYTEDFVNSNNIVRVIKFLNIRDIDISKLWIQEQLKKDKLLINLISKSVYKGYGESNKRFITYHFPFNEYNKLINIDELKEDILKLLKSNNIEIYDYESKLGMVVFSMPKRSDDPYDAEEINKFCDENGINFNCIDKFIDN